ncbi:MAG: class I tRNA ligase family protein, partial [Firmicutes bacterium]|nr:class I tRNA ligase family protein [Bacillota bacterium]
VLDESGKKMSKSRGNVIDPFAAFDQHGADALRFYFLTNTQPWNSQLFYHKAVAEAKSRFIDLLQNIHAFYALYATIDGYRPGASDAPPVHIRPLMDRWVLARLAQTIVMVDGYLEAYNATDAGRTLQAFVEDLSTWYVRRNRERFWAPGADEDKLAAFSTLFTCLYEVARMAAPFCPFVAEDLYQNITADAGLAVPESVHLCDFATVDAVVAGQLASWRDDALTARMQRVLRVVELGRALRNQSRIKTRQPLATLYIAAAWQSDLSDLEAVVLDELNIKEVQYAQLDAIAAPTLHLDLRAVGQAFGSRLPDINRAAKSATADQARAFARDGKIELAGCEVTADHCQVVYAPAFPGVLEVRDDGFVALATELTPELIEEGHVRELISKMQMMRKEVNYGVTSHVSFFCAGDDQLMDVLARHADEIKATVLATAITPGETPAHLRPDLVKEWDVNGKKLTIAVCG